MKKIFLILISLLMLTYDVYAASDVTDINTQQKLVDTDKSKGNVSQDDSALDTVEQYEGESIAPGSTYDVGKTLLKLSHADKVRPPF
ncbi:hypothetical protein AB4F11_06060, partial [Francisella philomiragia]